MSNTLKLEGSALPEEIRNIPDPPQALYTRGIPLSSIMERPRLAIVGTRRLSPYGQHVTHKLAFESAKAGVVIVSGLALGVDGVAHMAALEAGGVTVAVLPGGIDKIYPRSHEGLARQIIEKGGALISENSGSVLPQKFTFLVRNRIISGLAEGVLITEAAERSGSLNTARHALEQGRTVFAVPGNITSELSTGTNNLIKLGAIPVTSVQDIYNALNWQTSKLPQQATAASEEERHILDLLKHGVSSGEELLIKSGLSAQDFTGVMTMLEINGVIRAMGANQWALA